MSSTETHITLTALACPGCDCGMCVSEAIEAIEQLPGVEHVRLDRPSIGIIVRYDAGAGSESDFRRVIATYGIELSE